MNRVFRLAMVAFGLLAAGWLGEDPEGAIPPEIMCPAGPPRSVSLPMSLNHNRVIVDAEFLRVDGSIRKARAWVDTGSQHLLVGEALARDLGLEHVKPGEPGTQYAQVWASRTPSLRLGGLELDMTGIATRILPGAGVLPGVPAEAGLPASALRHSHVVFDYPAMQFRVARPGVFKPKGRAVPCQVNAETGLFHVTVIVESRTFRLGIDTGSAGTWVSTALTSAWKARHPDWPSSTGAVGSANFFGFPFEPGGVLMRLPELRIGAVRVQDAGLLGLEPGLFEWYSKKSAGPVSGFLGANVLKEFRLEVDFPNRMTYWEAGRQLGRNDLDIVGLTLRPETDGTFTVAGVAMKGGRPAVPEVAPGDRLLQVDGRPLNSRTMGAAVELLRGKPGATRILELERAGKRFTVKAVVTRFP
jgi:hypothetical protein